jgi:hypothetical protein
MRKYYFKGLSVLAIFVLISISVCEAQPTGSGPVGREKTGFFQRIFTKKPGKGVKKPRSAKEVKKEQEKKDKKKQKEYAQSVKDNQQRAYKIQTPEVQARMKQNQKDIAEREKAKKKKTSESQKKARKKYKK